MNIMAPRSAITILGIEFDNDVLHFAAEDLVVDFIRLASDFHRRRSARLHSTFGQRFDMSGFLPLAMPGP